MANNTATVALVPPFTRETAIQKVRKAEDGWNSRNPQQVSLAYTPDSKWRNRSEFVTGRDEIVKFLTRKWQREFEYRLIKELWAFDGVMFQALCLCGMRFGKTGARGPFLSPKKAYAIRNDK
jgi:nuclear transport factor 2 (NTF2) superfamily protein